MCSALTCPALGVRIDVGIQHMSPKTMAALTKSPSQGRRSSSGSGSLRPILPLELDPGTAIDDTDDDDELGPMPKEPSGPFQAGAGVDEVEYAYGSVALFTAVECFHD